jgi:hypothetical protein
MTFDHSKTRILAGFVIPRYRGRSLHNHKGPMPERMKRFSVAVLLRFLCFSPLLIMMNQYSADKMHRVVGIR